MTISPTLIELGRAQGVSWEELARPYGLSGDALRKRYSRMAKRQLELDVRQEYWRWIADRPRKHLVIPDNQLKPGVPLEFMRWIGRYIHDKQPDVVVHLGDLADMHSLSSYDRGKRSAENARYSDDIDVVNEGLALLHSGMDGYKPELQVFCVGNHEQRIERYTNDNPELYGTLGYHSFDLEVNGWVIAPFLQPVDIDGVLYSHFFPRSPNGRVVQSKYGAPDAATQVKREHQSATAGHTPGLSLAVVPAGRKLLRGVIAGSCYLHDEAYLTPQGNTYWRGVIVKHQVSDGMYNLMEVDLDFLRRKYA